MGYTTSGAEGKVVSWGSANFYSTLLSRVTPATARMEIVSEDIDVTGLDVETQATLPGLKTWTAEINARAFVPPRMGSVGTLTWGDSTYGLHVREWEWTIETEQAHDITELASSPASGPVWRSFRPDGVKITGRYTCRADSSTAASIPVGAPTASASLPTLTLVYGDSATDESISGAAMNRRLTSVVSRGQLNDYTYEFTGHGDWTPAGTNSLFGSSAFGIPLWSQGGSAAGALVIATLTGSKTLSGADSFWTRMTLRCAVNEPVTIDIVVQGVGAVTPA